MAEQLDLRKYQDKKLIAFDLYGTCINHHFKNVRLSWKLRDILKTKPITLQDIQEWKIEIDWVKIQVDDEFIGNIRKDIEWTYIFWDTLETLEYIKSKWYKTAVVSNLSKDYAEPLYRLIPEWLFDYKILSFEVWATKSDLDSRIYENLKTKSWIDFKDMIMIWDSLKADVVWSNNVWITPIHLNRADEWWIKEVEKLWIKFIQIYTLADLMKIL